MLIGKLAFCRNKIVSNHVSAVVIIDNIGALVSSVKLVLAVKRVVNTRVQANICALVKEQELLLKGKCTT